MLFRSRSRNENIAKACNNFAAIMTSINYRALNSCFDYHNVVNEVPSTSINSLNERLCKLSIDPAIGVIESKYSAVSTDKVSHNNVSEDRLNPLDDLNVSGAGKVPSSTNNTGIDYQSSILISAALDNKDAIVETGVENKDLITVDNVKTASKFVNTLNENQNDPFSAFP